MKKYANKILSKVCTIFVTAEYQASYDQHGDDKSVIRPLRVVYTLGPRDKKKKRQRV
jgi:hypothetical protein